MGRRIGFLGGTFDPPHCGHALLAQYAYEQANLDELWWVLTPRSPFKREVYSTLEQRIHMVELIVASQQFSYFSSVDLDREPPYYTLDTAKLLRQSLSEDDQLFFIMGGDSLRNLPKWYGAVELVHQVLDGLIVARRPGDELDLSRTEKALPGITNKTILVDMKKLDIASREIRDKIQRGLSVEGELTPEVVSYIQSNHIYQNISASEERG